MTSITETHFQEEWLIKELKRGSNKAFNQIYVLYAKRLYAYCYKFTKLQEEAEEIVQDTFLRLWRAKVDIKQEETVQSLLFIMAKRLMINAYRLRNNHQVYEEKIDQIETPSTDSADYNIEYEEFYKIFQAGMKTLPKTQQKVIKMSRFNKLSNKEIAEKLSLSEQTVKNQLSVGLKALEEYLNKIEQLSERKNRKP